MRRPNLKVVEYKHSKTARWVIEGIRVNGKRRRLFFKTQTAAEQELTRIKTKQKREGQDALQLSDSVRIMALEVSRDLRPFDKTLPMPAISTSSISARPTKASRSRRS